MKTLRLPLLGFAKGALALLLAQAAQGDEVQLKSGGRLIGMTLEGDTHIVVDLPNGTIVVPKDQVAAIVPGRTLLHEYEDRYTEAASKGTAAAYQELALWARGAGITRGSRISGLLPKGDPRLPESEDGTAPKDQKSRGAIRPAAVQSTMVGRTAPQNRGAGHSKAHAPEGVPYSLGFPRYDSNRGSHVWGCGWYSTFGTDWWMIPLGSKIRGFVPPLPKIPDSGRIARPERPDDRRRVKHPEAVKEETRSPGPRAKS